MTKSLTADQVSLGFIGIGAMGSRIVRRLRDHKYEVAVYDRDPSKGEALLPYGVSVAGNLAQLSATADVILSCLTDDDAVRTVYLSPKGVLASARAGTVLLEMSTISPQTSREVSARAVDRSIRTLDVAISGSTPAVESGSVTLLAGGDADLFEAAGPIFRTMAARYFLLGPSGAGTTMKLVVNTLLGIGMQAIAEAIVLGEAAGLDRKRLLEVLSQTAVVAPAHVGKLAKAQADDYSSQFPIGLMNKDLRLILETADLSNLNLPATGAVFRVNSAALKEDATSDFSSVIRYMENLGKRTANPKKASSSDRSPLRDTETVTKRNHHVESRSR